MSAPRESRTDGQTPPQPVNVVDGIPDRSPSPAAWKYVLLAGVFVAWVAFLIYCAAAGNTT